MLLSTDGYSPHSIWSISSFVIPRNLSSDFSSEDAAVRSLDAHEAKGEDDDEDDEESDERGLEMAVCVVPSGRESGGGRRVLSSGDVLVIVF